MENKENLFHSSKIPLPVAPLPAVPRRLLTETKHREIKERHPLQTLYHQTLNSARAGPNNNVKLVPNKLKHAPNVNPAQAALRKNGDNSDQDYQVFNDRHKEGDITDKLNDVDEGKCSKNPNEKKVLNLAENGNNCLGEQRPAVTPVIKSAQLEHSRIRNIKRSLRRPHSRELQGLSPAAKQAEKCEDSVKRRLHFNNVLVHGKLREPVSLVESYMKCLNRDYSMDLFNNLLSIEKKPIHMPKMPWITRACVINWLVKINGAEANAAVVQSACWYLDSLMGSCFIEMDKLQLVAAACYWIAQKLQGPVYHGLRLVALADNAFTLEELQSAERTVMKRLKFPNIPVVPQDFITYLSWWCNNHNPAEIEDASTFICMSGLMVDKALCDEFPSAIAAASVRNALLLMGKKDLLADLQMCPVFIAAENKSPNMAYICAILRRAVRTVSAPKYEYKTLCEQYGRPPKYVAQSILCAANEFSVLDTRRINK